jgi:hypothetical protein
VLTEADGGVTVRLLTGQSVNTVLAPNRISQWHVPVANGAALRSVSTSGGYPGEEPARATFLAVRLGVQAGSVGVSVENCFALPTRSSRKRSRVAAIGGETLEPGSPGEGGDQLLTAVGGHKGDYVGQVRGQPAGRGAAARRNLSAVAPSIRGFEKIGLRSRATSSVHH